MIPLLDLHQQYAVIREEIKQAVEEVLESQKFILGPQVQQLEEKIARYCQVKHAVGAASGSDALLLSMMALGVGPGDEVVTTPYTFFSTAGSISRLGARPVFVDIDRRTYNINPSLIDVKITPRTKAIIPVHLFGQCADMDPILGIARKHNLPVIEDAAQAIGALYKGKQAGSMGNFGCLSFFPSKNLGGIGDGGMILTNDSVFAERLKLLRVHGAKPKYFHSIVGCGSRLDSIQAAVLLVKLKYLDRWSQKRRENAALYDKHFAGSPVETPCVEAYNTHIYNQYILRSTRRDALKKFLSDEKIETEIYYPLPLHLQPCYKDLGGQEGDYPEAEKAAKETLALPIYPELTKAQQEHICAVAGRFHENEAAKQE